MIALPEKVIKSAPADEIERIFSKMEHFPLAKCPLWDKTPTRAPFSHTH